MTPTAVLKTKAKPRISRLRQPKSVRAEAAHSIGAKPVTSAAAKAYAAVQQRQNQSMAQAYTAFLGLKPVDTVALQTLIKNGLEYKIFETLARNADIAIAELAELVQITPRTLARRKETGRLAPDESDRLLRFARVYVQAISLYAGNAAGAKTWFFAPQRAFGGVSPAAMSETDTGCREIEYLIGRLEHGVFS